MTGYQEILTDPSYKAQIVAMTYPQIGNYGINDIDVESYKAHLSGFIVRALSPVVSSWRANRSLDAYLKEEGIPGIEGIDTRALTKTLRTTGALKGCLSNGGITSEAAICQAQNWRGLIGVNYVKEVTHREAFEWDANFEKSRAFKLPTASNDNSQNDRNDRIDRNDQIDRSDFQSFENNFTKERICEIPIVALDLGIKYNILRRLRQYGFKPYLMPAGTSFEAMIARKPAGVFLSNGPGDPSALREIIEKVRRLIDFGMPLFGICFGHQMLGLALGGKSFKLKFGHRGANQPVKHLPSGRVEITAQNHGFAIEAASLPSEVEVDRINLNDQTVEGISHKHKPILSVQYHPEASPGPHDSTSLFADFRKMIESI